MKLITLLAASAAAIFSTAPAAAAKVVYTYTSVFTGTNDGSPFVVPATFTGIGDTEVTSSIVGFPLVPLSSFTADSSGVPFVISTPFSFGYDALTGAAAFYAGGINAFAFASSALIGYDGTSSVSGITLPFYTNSTFATDRGNIVLTGQTAGTFSAAVEAVPESTTWAMMIGGFGIVGGVMRSRRAARTIVRFA